MAKVPDSGEDHGQAETVGGGDDVIVFHGATGLDDGGCAGSGDSFKSIRERKEGVGCGYGALKGENRFLRAEAGGVNAAHLARAYAYGLAIARIDDSVGLDVLRHAPGKDEAA